MNYTTVIVTYTLLFPSKKLKRNICTKIYIIYISENITKWLDWHIKVFVREYILITEYFFFFFLKQQTNIKV